MSRHSWTFQLSYSEHNYGKKITKNWCSGHTRIEHGSVCLIAQWVEVKWGSISKTNELECTHIVQCTIGWVYFALFFNFMQMHIVCCYILATRFQREKRDVSKNSVSVPASREEMQCIPCIAHIGFPWIEHVCVCVCACRRAPAVHMWNLNPPPSPFTQSPHLRFVAPTQSHPLTKSDKFHPNNQKIALILAQG